MKSRKRKQQELSSDEEELVEKTKINNLEDEEEKINNPIAVLQVFLLFIINLNLFRNME